MPNLSAVEFALCVLSMFARVIDENRIAVQVLLEAINSYNPSTRTFAKRAAKQVGYGARSSLRALAAYLGKDYNMKELRTEDGAQAILHTILDPVIGSLSGKELARAKKDIAEAMRATWCVPEAEVRAAVGEFTAQAWEDGRREYWMGVWKKANRSVDAASQDGRAEDGSGEGDQLQATAVGVEVTKDELPSEFAVVPMMSTLRRRARVARMSRPGSFPSAMDVCLGLGSLPSDHWCMDKDPVWHAHGWKLFYPSEFSSLYREERPPVDFRFPPVGILTSTWDATTPAKSDPMDSQEIVEMTRKLRQWEDEWEKQQLDIWMAAIDKSDALCYMAEWTENKELWHEYGRKKYDRTGRSGHKERGYRFPLDGSGCSTPGLSSGATSPVESTDSLETDAQYRKWEEKWEAEQVGKWAAGLKGRVERGEGRLWKRLATGWKLEGVEEEDVEGVDTEGPSVMTSRSLTTRIGRLLGLA
ncbi:unnamed protein product [Rhizoctonia solani]|uniref:Uncharacterized protein n=1 Tax=Rhizoctonia solani TaxID=456999 RepID=A0A8H3GCE0_9AGAM|nr:unnamed protein product [Rhizoctonia solani]